MIIIKEPPTGLASFIGNLRPTSISYCNVLHCCRDQIRHCLVFHQPHLALAEELVEDCNRWVQGDLLLLEWQKPEIIIVPVGESTKRKLWGSASDRNLTPTERVEVVQMKALS